MKAVIVAVLLLAGCVWVSVWRLRQAVQLVPDLWQGHCLRCGWTSIESDPSVIADDLLIHRALAHGDEVVSDSCQPS